MRGDALSKQGSVGRTVTASTIGQGDLIFGYICGSSFSPCCSPTTMSLCGDPLDEDYVRTRLMQPPFVTIDGVLNIRDLGSYPTTDPSLITKPSLMYRSGEVSGITVKGIHIPLLLSSYANFASLTRQIAAQVPRDHPHL